MNQKDRINGYTSEYGKNCTHKVATLRILPTLDDTKFDYTRE
jgi:hypothetical protein